MRGGSYFGMLLLILLSGCTKFEDADMTKRNTFVHFFSSGTSYVGVVAEIDTDGGFILSGTVLADNVAPDALIIKTDARGHKVWEQRISKGVVNAVKPHNGGYILVGDSIQLNTGLSGVLLSELENTYARVVRMGSDGTVIEKNTLTGWVRVGNDTLTVDYRGSAFDFDPAGNVVVLGSYRFPGDRESSFLSAFDPANISDSLWYQPYEFEQDLFNCDALHVTNSSEIVWAGRIQSQVGNLTREFMGVSLMPANSTFQRYKQYGESDQRNHTVEDLQPASVGYCAIGTYTETNGSNGNMYFLLLDPTLGTLTQKYIDGQELMLNNTVLDFDARLSSSSDDEGLAVLSTSDGFVLAGTMTSTPAVGHGGKDILLVKLDVSGNVLWKHLIGGSGDETVSSIRETPDGGLLLCGTNTVNGLSTIMLVKTDRNGKLDN